MFEPKSTPCVGKLVPFGWAVHTGPCSLRLLLRWCSSPATCQACRGGQQSVPPPGGTWAAAGPPGPSAGPPGPCGPCRTAQAFLQASAQSKVCRTGLSFLCDGPPKSSCSYNPQNTLTRWKQHCTCNFKFAPFIKAVLYDTTNYYFLIQIVNYNKRLL